MTRKRSDLFFEMFNEAQVTHLPFAPVLDERPHLPDLRIAIGRIP